ncbi:hypothetical protein HZS61_015779 [Fusarium oxysporum f. sp. conglutinans]|uniref:Uncharacterized protein n=1 Tax=Fusarium oxysporum f. sp. conglutinans TaxID=100902 RepID=A0A8H6LJU8_FUSOX|nr:hypothetical protein HZS61_015779 [Fusarium oxysporum f. sp. conglutinans]
MGGSFLGGVVPAPPLSLSNSTLPAQWLASSFAVPGQLFWHCSLAAGPRGDDVLGIPADASFVLPSSLGHSSNAWDRH